MQDKYNDLEIDEVQGHATIGARQVGVNIAWSSETLGFGNLGIIYNDGGIVFDHENMSKEFCIALLTKLVEKYYI